MPQIPLFVSSAKAGTDSTGSFSVDFLPPMELPATAKNATIEVRSSPFAAVVVISGVGDHTSEWDKVVHTIMFFIFG
eukprot:COSAG02_NODE_6885_length_3309_cov_1.979439_3_plen_77_part_00